MRGKVCVITGATDGIGQVAAYALARAGAHVVVVGRNGPKCVRVCEEIRTAHPGADVAYQVADLSVLAEVRALGARLGADCPRIDVLLNNAGAFFYQRVITSDGIERTFALNHLAYFLLTHLLLDSLRASDSSRVINVSSRAHVGGRINFSDLTYERDYSGWRAYCASKLANILFTFELAQRLSGTTVTANCLHPGLVSTRFALNNGRFVRTAAKVVMALRGISADQGAKTSVFLASDPAVGAVSGKYFYQCAPALPSLADRDTRIRKRLWDVSTELVGLAD